MIIKTNSGLNLLKLNLSSINFYDVLWNLIIWKDVTYKIYQINSVKIFSLNKYCIKILSVPSSEVVCNKNSANKKKSPDKVAFQLANFFNEIE